MMGAQVNQSFERSDRTYGQRHVWHDVLEQGQACGLHRIKRLIREQTLRARPRRRGLSQEEPLELAKQVRTLGGRSLWSEHS